MSIEVNGKPSFGNLTFTIKPDTNPIEVDVSIGCISLIGSFVRSYNQCNQRKWLPITKDGDKLYAVIMSPNVFIKICMLVWKPQNLLQSSVVQVT